MRNQLIGNCFSEGLRIGDSRGVSRRLDEYLKSVNAQMPAPNPNYDPSKPSETTSREGKRKKDRQ